MGQLSSICPTWKLSGSIQLTLCDVAAMSFQVQGASPASALALDLQLAGRCLPLLIPVNVGGKQFWCRPVFLTANLYSQVSKARCGPQVYQGNRTDTQLATLISISCAKIAHSQFQLLLGIYKIVPTWTPKLCKIMA